MKVKNLSSASPAGAGAALGDRRDLQMEAGVCPEAAPFGCPSDPPSRDERLAPLTAAPQFPRPPAEAQNDFTALLNALVPFAAERLQAEGAFFPFAATVSPTGGMTVRATYDDSAPSAADLLAGLVRAFQSDARNGIIRASGICYDGRIELDGKKMNAVVIKLEHASGYASNACVPYFGRGPGKFRFGDLVVALDEPQIFCGHLTGPNDAIPPAIAKPNFPPKTRL